ncbi:murein hydrolase activator EnvC family protein [Microbacterium flavum]|nr:M23 family metallopeptidase [Microbacterium flavum]
MSPFPPGPRAPAAGSSRRRTRDAWPRVAALVLGLSMLGALIGPASAAAQASVLAPAEARTGWVWPVTPPRITAPYAAPAHEYGPGHRGIDLAAPLGTPLSSPAAGVIAFAGSVAGRGVVTIDHGDGYVTTLEPVSDAAAIGREVEAGDVVARAGTGGHAAPGSVHFGVRKDGAYINPMLLLGTLPRAVLLPCCEG